MDRQSIFIALCVGLLFSCAPKEREIIRLFNERNYTELESHLSDDGTWQMALFFNKFATEQQLAAPFSPRELWQRFSADTLKKSYALHPFYTQFKYRSDAYTKTLMALADSSSALRKPEFYYPSLFQFLESKHANNRQFAYGKLVGDFNFRYSHNLFSSVRRILEDSTKPKLFKQKLKQLAAEFDRYDKETTFYDSLRLADTPRIKPILLPSSDQIEAFFRFRGKNGAAESPHLEEITSYDLFHAPDSVLRQFLPTVASRPDLAEKFILSNRKIHIDSTRSVERLLESSHSFATKRRLVQQFKFVEPDSVLHLLANAELPAFARLYFFAQLDLDGYTSKKMSTLFSLFEERKLQADIEKAVKKYPADSLRQFFVEKLEKGDDKAKTYAMYLIGITKLTSFKADVEKLRKSPNRNVAFEAEQTLIRLNK